MIEQFRGEVLVSSARTARRPVRDATVRVPDAAAQDLALVVRVTTVLEGVCARSTPSSTSSRWLRVRHRAGRWGRRRERSRGHPRGSDRPTRSQCGQPRRSRTQSKSRARRTARHACSSSSPRRVLASDSGSVRRQCRRAGECLPLHRERASASRPRRAGARRCSEFTRGRPPTARTALSTPPVTRHEMRQRQATDAADGDE